MDELLDEYEERFGERFPLACCLASDDEIIEAIRECLRTGEKYDPYKGFPEGDRVVF